MKNLSAETVLALAGLAYEMPIDQGATQRFTQALSQTCGSRAAGFTVDIFGPEPSTQLFWTGLPEESLSAYVGHLFAEDPWREVNKRLPVGRAHTNDALIDPSALVRTSFYSDFCESAGIVDGCCMVLDRSEERTIVLSTVFDKRLASAEPLRRLLDTIAPHIRRAVVLWEQMERTRVEGASLADAFERLPLAAALLDRRGCVVRTNNQAVALLSQGDGLVLSRQGLSAADKTADRALRSLADAAGPVSIPVKRPSGRRPYVLIAHALPVPRACLLDQRNATILVYLVDPDAPAETKTVLLQRLFKLSPAEARLTTMLADGLVLKEIAQQLDVSYNTVRVQLQHVFAKTGTDRQAALVSLVAKLSAAH
jgi:DNA-binding CsgD family transcriptional regulator